jgi:hypothetical protein
MAQAGQGTFPHAAKRGGDFVLFDALGEPWPIHSCYLELGCQGGVAPTGGVADAYTNHEWAQQIARQQQAYKLAARQPHSTVIDRQCPKSLKCRRHR